jgi:hypothetical protein
MQNIRRGHYELAVDVSTPERVAVAVAELARPSSLGQTSTQTLWVPKIVSVLVTAVEPIGCPAHCIGKDALLRCFD